MFGRQANPFRLSNGNARNLAMNQPRETHKGTNHSTAIFQWEDWNYQNKLNLTTYAAGGPLHSDITRPLMQWEDWITIYLKIGGKPASSTFQRGESYKPELVSSTTT